MRGKEVSEKGKKGEKKRMKKGEKKRMKKEGSGEGKGGKEKERNIQVS